MYDLVVVGSGPAGLSCASHAAASGLECIVLERAGHVADTIFNYQARKYVMAEPSAIPMRGDLPFAPGARESILEAWQKHAVERKLNVELGADVRAIERRDGAFVVTTAAAKTYDARNVVIAMGTQGNPRKLGVPGDALPHVHYHLVDAAEHRDRDILVVGGGDSALEIAIALSDRNRVTVIMLEPEITYANEVLTREILSRQAAGRVTIHYATKVKEVFEREADLDVADETVRIPAELIFVKIGADPPRKFLEKCGVAYASDARDARPVLSPVHETSVAGIYLIGAAAARDLIKLGINQGYEVVEHLMGREVEPADEALLRERLPFWTGTVRERIEAIRGIVPLLAAADEMTVRSTFLSADVREYRDGETIFAQDDYTTDLLLVASGRVELFRTTKLAEVETGGFFGEGSLISSRRRDMTARAAGVARIIAIPRKAMLKLLANAPAARSLVDRAFLLRVLSALFPGVEERSLAALAAASTIEKFKKGAVIYREGEDAGALYLIRSGMVKISRHSRGRDVVLTYFVAGRFFGDGALMPAAKRTVSATAMFAAEVVRLSRESFEEFVAGHPQLREPLMKKVEERWIASLVAESTPAAGMILGDLIREEVVMGTHTLLIDRYRCVRCGNCVSACRHVHDDGHARLALTGRRFYNLLAPNSCWHCENPLCMLDCPPDAIARDPAGEVYIRSNCIGCGNCAKRCPYGNIFLVHEGEQTRAVKCDLCRDLRGGPACVRACPTGAAVRVTPDRYRKTLEELVVVR